MDILYCASWRLAQREPQNDPSNRAAQPSGIGRLLLALAVIAIMVGVLEQAAGASSPPNLVASSTLSSHLGASK
jgi:hypothetical protein